MQNMTFAFQPVSTRTGLPGRGRGGGMSRRLETTLGSLPPIDEPTEVGKEDLTETGMEDQDTSNIMAGSVPPQPDQQEKPCTTFTFRAQLTWGLTLGTRVNLPMLFQEWVNNTRQCIPDVELLQFDDKKANMITTSDQVQDDNPGFYKDYYHNHRVLNPGNLTEMVHFQCSVSWNKVKRVKEPYFQWLHQSKIYLNLTKFKSATLVVCGFLEGAHPGHLCREDAEVELHDRLQLPTDFQFQLSS
jgi:hypothetical protein